MMTEQNNYTMEHEERRHFSRVDFRHELTLKDNSGTLYEGAFNDISLRGMLFWCENLPMAELEVFGTMPLGDSELRIHGIVLWSDSKRGAAIEFKNMDIESFSHLRRLVALNMGDPEVIDRELFESL
ncbi:MAG: PilZ domain-containing protein [Magnetococcales bacterium]|nr:PilZ domain-containing protein [Magnetococcales bacterium]